MNTDPGFLRLLTPDDLDRAAAGETEHLPATLADWPKLIPFGERHLPRLRARLLPSWAGAYCEALAAATETPEERPWAL